MAKTVQCEICGEESFYDHNIVADTEYTMLEDGTWVCPDCLWELTDHEWGKERGI